MTPTSSEPRKVIRRLNLIGLTMMAVMLGGIGTWAATTHMAGAVIASGTLVVESNVKRVQHPTGGIVGEILVKEGGAVKAGDVVMRLDDTLTRSSLGIARSQLEEFTIREARLLAERDGADTIEFPPSIMARASDATVKGAMTGEERLFVSRRATRDGQRSQLRERVLQTGEEVRGLSSQLRAKEGEIGFVREELVGVSELFEKKLTPIIRFMQLQRDQAKLEGERGQFIAEIARAKGKISETELQILQIEHDYRTEVLRELRDAQGKIAELKERVIAAQDQLKRTDLLAPQDGTVHQLAVHTVGGVIANGEVVMQIVPKADGLVVEAKVAPPDIDQLSVGSRAAVRIMAGNQRITPDVAGEVTRIGADLVKEQQTGLTYYLVRIALNEASVARLPDIVLLPGMPAESFIQTQERTPLQFLLKPLQDQIARTFRER